MSSAVFPPSRRAAHCVLLGLCVLLAFGVPGAHAARTTVGSLSSTPAWDCGSWLNDSSTVRTCTIAGLRLGSSGVLTSVRVNHSAPFSATSTELKAKRLRYDGEDGAGPIYSVLGPIGTPATVASGATTTAWTDLTQSVSAGDYLGLTVIDAPDVPAASRLEFAAQPGSGIYFYPGDSSVLDAGKAGATNTAMNMEADIRTPPVIEEITGPSGPTRDDEPLFGFTADESADADETGPFFDCRIDDAPDWEPCDSGEYQSTKLAEGDHTFRVRALSQFGDPLITQTGPVSEQEFRVDRTPPQTSIDSGPGGGATIDDPQPTFAFSASETAAFECRLDGGDWLGCTSPAMPAQPLGDGAHLLEVAATDEAGNRDASPARADFSVRRPAQEPATSRPLGFDFAGLTASGTDPVDSAGGPLSSDIESARAVYDPSSGRAAVVVRFYGPIRDAQRDRVDVFMAPTADCSGSRDAGVWFSTDTQSAPVATYGGSQRAEGSKRISDDGRELLLTWSSPRIQNLSLRCLEVQTGHQEYSWDPYVVYDRLVTPGFQRNDVVPRPVVTDVAAIIATLRGSLPTITRSLARQTPRRLARKRAIVLPVDAPGPGAVGLELSVRRGGAKRVLAVGARPVTQAAADQKVSAKITKLGRKVLRRGKPGMKVTVRAGFLPQGSDRLLAATRAVRLAGRR